MPFVAATQENTDSCLSQLSCNYPNLNEADTPCSGRLIGVVSLAAGMECVRNGGEGWGVAVTPVSGSAKASTRVIEVFSNDQIIHVCVCVMYMYMTFNSTSFILTMNL